MSAVLESLSLDDIRAERDRRRWKDDPVAFVRDVFQVEADPWQVDALTAFPRTNRLAFKACKGPGKTAVLAWLIWNFLVTRPHPRIAATSITEDNLKGNLWRELAKWQSRSAFLREQFEWTATKVMKRSDPATWFAEARNWPKSADATKQADTLAGIHEDYCLFVLDESGGIPQAVMTTAEAVLATGVETKVVQAGNPTQLEGPLHRACTADRHLWAVVEITGDPDDPKRSPRIDLDWAKQQIATYGRENPWVMVNVLGKFPPSSLNSLLGPEDVQAAMQRSLESSVYDWADVRLGIDVARYGDDRTVIFPRQGRKAFAPEVMRHGRDTSPSVDIATKVMALRSSMKSKAEVFDATGGWAAGAVDVMTASGARPVSVQFHGTPANDKYKNRRAEMWFGMAEWIKSGGQLPNIPELIGELTVPTYTFVGGKFLIEPKENVKERLGRSPDLADALALTFAIPEGARPVQAPVRQTATYRGEGGWMR